MEPERYRRVKWKFPPFWEWYLMHSRLRIREQKRNKEDISVLKKSILNAPISPRSLQVLRPMPALVGFRSSIYKKTQNLADATPPDEHSAPNCSTPLPLCKLLLTLRKNSRHCIIAGWWKLFLASSQLELRSWWWRDIPRNWMALFGTLEHSWYSLGMCSSEDGVTSFPMRTYKRTFPLPWKNATVSACLITATVEYID